MDTSHKPSPGITLSLVSLAIGGFSIGMTEFLMMGVLPDLSGSLHVSIPTAGHLISIYALGVVIGAPLIVGLAGHLPPKKVLISLMLMVFAFNGLFAIVPGFPLLMIMRFLAGLPHGAFFGIGAVVASRMAEPGRQARAISVMFAGLTVANIIGVPLGTYIGHHFSWRISFLLISAVALLAVGAIAKWLPSLKANQAHSFSSSMHIFKKPELWIIIGISAIGTGGMFAWISYIAPLMTEVAHFNSNSITIIMVIAGLGMATGNLISGRFSDRYLPLQTTTWLLALMILSLLATTFLIQYKPAAILMVFITGSIGFSVISPMQMLIMQAAKGSEMLASSVLQASSNMGNALGAFLGGLPIAAGFGYLSAEYVGVALASCGFVFCLILKNYLHFGKKTSDASFTT